MEAVKEAVQDRDSRSFYNHDLYAWLTTDDATIIAHGVRPELVGHDLRGRQDATGDYFMRRMVEEMRVNDRIWIDYVWPNPVTSAHERKSTTFVRLGHNALIAVGVYANDH